MAFSLSVKHESGVTLSYWRIVKFDIDMLLNQTRLTISGYVSSEARNAGNKPVADYKFFWFGADNPITPTTLMAGTALTACYNKIKATAPGFNQMNPVVFADATSV